MQVGKNLHIPLMLLLQMGDMIILIPCSLTLIRVQGGQMVVLGKASDGRVQREFEDLANLVIDLRFKSLGLQYNSRIK